MFPQIPRSAIEADLARTGNVNTTCERILAGEIVIVSIINIFNK